MIQLPGKILSLGTLIITSFRRIFEFPSEIISRSGNSFIISKTYDEKECNTIEVGDSVPTFPLKSKSFLIHHFHFPKAGSCNISRKAMRNSIKCSLLL